MFTENILQEVYLAICLGAIGILGCGVIYLYLSQRSQRNTLERKLESECYLRLDNMEEKLEKILAYIEQDSKKIQCKEDLSLHTPSLSESLFHQALQGCTPPTSQLITHSNQHIPADTVTTQPISATPFIHPSDPLYPQPLPNIPAAPPQSIPSPVPDVSSSLAPPLTLPPLPHPLTLPPLPHP